MKITLRPVTKENFDAIACLNLLDHQRDYVASNSYSIAEASFNPFLTTRAVYAGELPVGFMMYLNPEQDDEEAGAYGIWRFMIDSAHQGKGYGRQALAALLDEIRANADVRSIYISYIPGNELAKRFYASFGFREVGIDEEGEMVAVLSCQSNDSVFAN
ncbi:GNAT family N-acetyltransferase [Chitinimonas koreensis]|uniref:GNAT family N-acetyltransferase n=1 Tax=Chitinimonas koreensis TaxID=356302 RepID=UPI0004901417|nr:GNAT family N-acetyltransferase [Chitinimonas koreensis]QNM95182.1 GNAT family N-acetyltransferase [Chitinimonas koreensis]